MCASLAVIDVNCAHVYETNKMRALKITFRDAMLNKQTKDIVGEIRITPKAFLERCNFTFIAVFFVRSFFLLRIFPFYYFVEAVGTTGRAMNLLRQ